MGVTPAPFLTGQTPEEPHTDHHTATEVNTLLSQAATWAAERTERTQQKTEWMAISVQLKARNPLRGSGGGHWEGT